ncbi:hypothetical protein F4802DRAFT_290507 [Xylaria palmicola]|nr:hypothetical protein F4802DRAFT_290507 [Xylaria palmicola]
MVASVQPSIDGREVDILRHPEHCAEARSAVNRLLDEIEITQSLWDAARAPRSSRYRAQFLRFVFERAGGSNGAANVAQARHRARRAALQRMNGLSVALCAAAYTEASIQNMSDALFQALLVCTERMGLSGGPCDGVHNETGLSAIWMELLPDGFLESILSVSVIAENTCYNRFVQDLTALIADSSSIVSSCSLQLAKTANLQQQRTMRWVRDQVRKLLLGTSRPAFVSFLDYILDNFRESTVMTAFRVDLAEVLLDAVKNVPVADRMCLLDATTRALNGSGMLRLRARLAYQKSVALRLTGDLPGSEREVLEFFRREGSQHELDGLSCAQLGWLHLSSANNHLYQSNFSRAHEEAKKLQLAGDVSGPQFELLWDQIYCVGRIMRGEGRFENAKMCFESCLQTVTDISKSKLTVARSALGDVYCELDYSCRQNMDSQLPPLHLKRARELVDSDIEARRGPSTKSLRRLLLSLSEIEIREGRLTHAKSILQELLVTYSALCEPDIVDRLGHVRAHIALARITSHSEAETHWREALRLNTFYSPDEEEVYTCGVIYLCLSHIRYVCGDSSLAADMFNHGMDIVSKKRPNHLIPGIATYIFDKICQKWETVQSVSSGWRGNGLGNEENR